MAYCILVGFGGGSSRSKAELWAIEHLVSPKDDIPEKRNMMFSDWAKRYFLSPYKPEEMSDIPETKTSENWIIWAKRNFITTEYFEPITEEKI